MNTQRRTANLVRDIEDRPGYQEAERYGRRVIQLIMDGKWQIAHRVIDEAHRKAHKQLPTTQQIMRQHLAFAGMDERMVNIFESFGAETVEEALNVPKEMFLRRHNVGDKCYRQAIDFFRDIGAIPRTSESGFNHLEGEAVK